MKKLIIYARAAALKRFCKQRSGPGGSRESGLIRVFSELVLYARAAALRRFCKQEGSVSAGSRESCLVMAHSVCL